MSGIIVISFENKHDIVTGLVNQDTIITMENIDLIENTLKEIYNLKRRKINALLSQMRHQSPSAHSRKHFSDYMKQLKEDCLYYCMDVINLVETKLLPRAHSIQQKVFFLKVIGDFFRYSAETVKRKDQVYQTILRQGLRAYSMAYQLSTMELPTESLVHLNVCLNFSVFYYTVVQDTMQACKLISKTLNKLESEKDSIQEEIWKSIQLHMGLLKNNLMLWLSELEEKKDN